MIRHLESLYDPTPAELAAFYVAKRVQMGLSGDVDGSFPSAIQACLDGMSMEPIALMSNLLHWNIHKILPSPGRPRISLWTEALSSGNLVIRWQPYGWSFNANHYHPPSYPDHDDWLRNPIVGAQIMERPDNEFYFIRDFLSAQAMANNLGRLGDKRRILLYALECMAIEVLQDDLERRLSHFAIPIWEQKCRIEWALAESDAEGSNATLEHASILSKIPTQISFVSREQENMEHLEDMLSWSLCALDIEEEDFSATIANLGLEPDTSEYRVYDVASKTVKAIAGNGGAKRVHRAIYALYGLGRLPAALSWLQPYDPDAN
jgi:hypothetical protein